MGRLIGVADAAFAIARKRAKFAKLSSPNRGSRHAAPQALTILLFGPFLASGAFAVTAETDDDPYVWLEDVHGQKPLAWVAEQNKKSLAVLKADPRYQKNYDSVLQVLDAPDRIPIRQPRSRLCL